MSRREKLLARFLTRPADFRIDEMSRLLSDLGYDRVRTGRTAESRIAFIHKLNGHIIRLHKPHPGTILKKYQMELVEEALRAKGIIE